jgi:hypothetical protein
VGAPDGKAFVGVAGLGGAAHAVRPCADVLRAHANRKPSILFGRERDPGYTKVKKNV